MASLPSLDPYQVLGVPKDATTAVIRSAHRRLVLKVHPDKVTDEANKAKALEEFQKIQQAYEILSDDSSRARFDEKVRLEKLREEKRKLRMKRFHEETSLSARGSSTSFRGEPGKDLKAKSSTLRSSQNLEEEEQPRIRSSFFAPRCQMEYSGAERQNQRMSQNVEERHLRRDSIKNGREQRPSQSCAEHYTMAQRATSPAGSALQEKSSTPKLSEESISSVANLSRAASKRLADQPLNEKRNTTEGLKGYINGIAVCALADTGADTNFIAQAVAKELHCNLVFYTRDARPTFIIGNGRMVHAVAHTKAPWQFRKEPERIYNVAFYVLSDCIFDIMMGGAFLYATGTMTLCRHRLSRIPRPRKAIHIRVVNLCGTSSRRSNKLTPSRRLNGVLQTEKCCALPDSGAEPNLLSYQYVKQRGWLLDMVPGPESCNLLQFADGSTESTEGRLYLEWSFDGKWDLTSPSAPFSVIFDVLRDCAFDVILGQDFLDYTNAFSKHIEAFQDVYHRGLPGLNLVFWANTVSKSEKRTTTPNYQQTHHTQPQPEVVIFEELERRVEADRRIARVRDDSDLYSMEVDRERSLRSQWEADYDHLVRQSTDRVAASRRRPSNCLPQPNRKSVSRLTPSDSAESSQTTSSSQTSCYARSSTASINETPASCLGAGRPSNPLTSQSRRRGLKSLLRRRHGQ